MEQFPSPPPLTRSSVRAAHEIIKSHIHLTPVLTSTTLNRIASTPQTAEALKGTPYDGHEPAKPTIRFFFKCENYQRIGAFKARGAFHAISRLPADIRSKGIVTHSSGMYTTSPSLYEPKPIIHLQETTPKPPPSPARPLGYKPT
jgi:threonine dehydratase